MFTPNWQTPWEKIPPAQRIIFLSCFFKIEIERTQFTIQKFEWIWDSRVEERRIKVNRCDFSEVGSEECT